MPKSQKKKQVQSPAASKTTDEAPGQLGMSRASAATVISVQRDTPPRLSPIYSTPGAASSAVVALDRPVHMERILTPQPRRSLVRDNRGFQSTFSTSPTIGVDAELLPNVQRFPDDYETQSRCSDDYDLHSRAPSPRQFTVDARPKGTAFRNFASVTGVFGHHDAGYTVGPAMSSNVSAAGDDGVSVGRVEASALPMHLSCRRADSDNEDVFGYNPRVYPSACVEGARVGLTEASAFPAYPSRCQADSSFMNRFCGTSGYTGQSAAGERFVGPLGHIPSHCQAPVDTVSVTSQPSVVPSSASYAGFLPIRPPALPEGQGMTYASAANKPSMSSMFTAPGLYNSTYHSPVSQPSVRQSVGTGFDNRYMHTAASSAVEQTDADLEYRFRLFCDRYRQEQADQAKQFATLAKHQRHFVDARLIPPLRTVSSSAQHGAEEILLESETRRKQPEMSPMSEIFNQLRSWLKEELAAQLAPLRATMTARTESHGSPANHLRSAGVDPPPQRHQTDDNVLGGYPKKRNCHYSGSNIEGNHHFRSPDKHQRHLDVMPTSAAAAVPDRSFTRGVPAMQSAPMHCPPRSSSRSVSPVDQRSREYRSKMRSRRSTHRHRTPRSSSSSSRSGKRRDSRRRSALAASSATNASLSSDKPRFKLPKGYRLPQFKGTVDEDIEVFFTHFNVCADSSDWTESEKLGNLRLALHGNAEALVNAYPNCSFDEFVGHLREQFGKANQQASCEAQLLQYRRKPGETIQQVQLAIVRLANWAFPQSEKTAMFKTYVRDAFIRALNDTTLADEVYRQRPHDIDSAAKIAGEFEAYFVSNRMQRSTAKFTRSDTLSASSVAEVCAAAGTDVQASRQSAKPWSADMEVLVKSINDLKSTVNRNQFKWKQSSPDNSNQNVNQPQRGSQNVDNGSQLKSTRDRRPVICYNCGEQGHVSRRCPKSQIGDGQQFKPDRQADSNSCAFSSPSGSQVTAMASSTHGHVDSQAHRANNVNAMQYGGGLRCYMLIFISGQPYRVLADTGCTMTCMSERLLPSSMPIQHKQLQMNAANKTAVRITGEITLNFRFERYAEEQQFPVAVSPDIEGIIFGLDLLTHFKCAWYMDRAYCDIAGCQVQLHPHAAGPAVRHIYTASKTVLQPRHEHDVAVCIPYNHSEDRAPALVLDARVVQPGVVAASVAVPGYAPEGYVKLLNLSARPRTIPEGTYIGDAYPFWSSASLSTLTAVPPISADPSGASEVQVGFSAVTDDLHTRALDPASTCQPALVVAGDMHHNTARQSSVLAGDKQFTINAATENCSQARSNESCNVSDCVLHHCVPSTLPHNVIDNNSLDLRLLCCQADCTVCAVVGQSVSLDDQPDKSFIGIICQLQSISYSCRS